MQARESGYSRCVWSTRWRRADAVFDLTKDDERADEIACISQTRISFAVSVMNPCHDLSQALHGLTLIALAWLKRRVGGVLSADAGVRCGRWIRVDYEERTSGCILYSARPVLACSICLFDSLFTRRPLTRSVYQRCINVGGQHGEPSNITSSLFTYNLLDGLLCPD